MKSPKKDLVLITGISGLIGAALKVTLARSFRVMGLDQQCDVADADCVIFDITSRELVAKALAELRKQYGPRIASVIHLAAYYDLLGDPSPLYEEVNVRGTQHLLQALQGFAVEQFVYASTLLVHAPTQPGISITEDSPLEAKWPYPQSKLAAERVIRAAHGHIPYVLLRIAGVYTDRCDSPFLAHQIQRIYERRLTGRVFSGDTSHGQSFVHIEDLTEACLRLVERRHQLPGELALLIGEPGVMSYAAVQNQLGHLVHGEQEWKTMEIPKPLAMTGAWLQEKLEPVVPDAIDQGEEPFIRPYMVALADDHYEIDTSRVRELLGWRPRHSLRETLPKMVQALKADPLAWYRRHKLTPPAWMNSAAAASLPADQVLEEHQAFLREAQRKTRWAQFMNMGLGAWLLTSPPILGYRDDAMVWNDLLCGGLVLILGALSLSWRGGWARVANAAVGMWLLFAPLVFWVPSAAAYANDTLIGALIIGLAVLVPHMPGVSPVARLSGPDLPPGWDYNPSAWTQRLLVIALAFIGLFISRYLAAYQLGHIPLAWDPFFGEGTERIITSEVSKVWPISDAGLGAVTYMLEILTGLLGDRRRWRTMPWVVVLFGIMIVPLGAVSIFFIIIQPILIGTWCSLCLIAAAAMLLQIPYSLDELLATGQFLLARRRAGKSLLRVFIVGDTLEGGRQTATDEFDRPPLAVAKEVISGGVTLPWNLLACIAIGVWLMSTRLIFGTEGMQAHSDHLIGALVITVSVTASAEMVRPLRFINILFGVALMGAPWMLAGGTQLADWEGVVAGLLLIMLSLPRGPVHSHYGDWDRLLV